MMTLFLGPKGTERNGCPEAAAKDTDLAKRAAGGSFTRSWARARARRVEPRDCPDHVNESNSLTEGGSGSQA